jgi:D-alanyl-D-alanine carboxypeptidase
MGKQVLRSRRAGGVVVALTAAAIVAGAAAPAVAGSVGVRAGAAARPAAELARLARVAVRAGAPGIVVRASDGRGRVITIARQARWTRADGILRPGDEFRMGSNTKTMIATIVLQEVARGKLKLTDPVSKWLPGLIPDGHAITLRMLLNHTSGLFNYIDNPAVLRAFTGQSRRRWTPQELLAAGVKYPPLFRPGARYSYSNTNYVALGLVLERVTGKSLPELIEQRITGPLHLEHTYLASGTPRSRAWDLAAGYEPDAARVRKVLPPGTPRWAHFVGPRRGDWVDTTWVNSTTEWAAGGMISTAGDWARFQSALLSGRLLPPAQLKEMRTTVAENPADPRGDRYGLGIERVVTPCGDVWGHDGQAPGYSSWDFADASGRRTVSVFTTTIFGLKTSPKAGAAVGRLLDDAVCVMLGKPLK